MAACNICQERVPLSSTSIAAHLLKAHGIGGRPVPVKKPPPPLLQLPTPIAGRPIKSEKKTAAVGPKVFSDNVADMCRVRCKFCNRDVSAGSVTKHARLYHGVASIQDYGEIEYVNPTYHSCKLCGLELIFTARTIQKHVTRRHRISPDAYRKSYLINSPGLSLPNASAILARHSPTPLKASGGPLLSPLPVGKPPPSSVEYTDDLRDFCWVRCRLCGEEESLDSIGQHCRQRHKSQAATPHAFTRRTFHACKVCGVEFQLSIGALCRHLLEAHKLALSSYIINYLGKQLSRVLSAGRGVLNSHEAPVIVGTCFSAQGNACV